MASISDFGRPSFLACLRRFSASFWAALFAFTVGASSPKTAPHPLAAALLPTWDAMIPATGTAILTSGLATGFLQVSVSGGGRDVRSVGPGVLSVVGSHVI